MRKINAWMFMTLDGVVEAPQTWVRGDEQMFAAMEADYATADVLLLGRRTYETFAASWPQRGSDVPNADWMNKTTKLVASTTLETLEWNNSTVIEGDLTEALERLKREPGQNILINGSATLVRALLRDGLLDQLTLYLHPVVVGTGQRLFDTGGDLVPLTLQSAHPYANGVIALTYQPTAH